MGKMDKTEKYTVAGLCFGGSGVFLCEDAVVCARVYPNPKGILRDEII